MESIIPALVIALFWIVRILLADGKNAAVPDASELSRRADAYRAQGNLSLEEHTVQALINKAEKEDGPNGLEVGIYLRRLALLKANQGNQAAALPILQRVLSIQESNLGPNSPDLIQTLDWLTQLSRAKDLDSAIAYTRRILAIRAAAHGDNPWKAAMNYNTLGLLLHEKDDREGAIWAFRRALEIREQHATTSELQNPELQSKDDQTELVVSLNNLAIVLKQQGQLAESESLHRRALNIQEKILAPDSPDFAPTLIALAEVLWRKPDLAAAEPLYRRSLNLQQKAFGPDDPRLTETLSQFGRLLTQKPDPVAAEPLLRRALALREKSTPANSLAIADARDHLASALRAQGNFAESATLLRLVLETREKELPPDHAGISIALGNLGWSLWQQREYLEAEACMRRALAIGERGGDDASRFVATQLLNLGSLLRDKGDFTAAEPLAWRALALEEKNFGPDHIACAETLEMLASLRTAQGDPRGAVPLLRQSLALKEKTFKPNHPQLANTLVNLAVTLAQAGTQNAGPVPTPDAPPAIPEPGLPKTSPALTHTFDEPESLLRRALLIYESALGSEHRAVGSTSFHLAACLHKKGRFAEAAPLYRRSLAIAEKVFGPEHTECANTMGMLAKLLHATGDLTGARLLMTRAYNIAAKTLGEKHPTTLDMKATLNGLMMKLAPPAVN